MQISLREYNFEYFHSGSGEPMVLVHGSASDYRTWNNQHEEFGKHFKCFVYSRRYHWPNEKITETEDYSMLQHVDDLEAILESIGEPVHLIGHSYGGFICLLLTLKNPMLVKTLVLAEPPVITLFISDPPKPIEFLKLLLKKPGVALTLLKFGAKGLGPAKAAAKQNDMDKAFEIFGKAVLGVDAFHSLPESRLEQARANVIKAEFLGSGLPPVDEQKIRSIKKPVLIIEGQESPKVFHDVADRLSELLPTAERATIPGASHNMHENNATYFNSVVLSFLEGHTNK